MRKILGLVLALVMILTAVSAFAAIPSKTTTDLITVETNSGTAIVTATANESPAVVALLTDLIEDNTAIPAAAKKALPEGTTVKEVKDAVTLRIDQGAAEADELVINLQLTSSFDVKEGEEKEIIALIGVLDGGKIAEWKSVKAIAKAGGKVDLVVPSDVQEWLGTREFIVLFAE